LEYVEQQRKTLTWVKEVGFNQIEMHYNYRPQWVADEIVQMVEELELRPYSIHLPKFLLSVPKTEFKKDIESIFGFIDRVGIKVSVLHPPSLEQIPQKEWKERMEIILKQSDQSCSVLTLEIVPYLQNPHMFIQEQINYHQNHQIGVTVDIEHMHLTGLKMEWMIEWFGDKILNVHLRDSDGSLLDANGRRKYLVPGEGNLDLQGILEILQQSNYDKALTIEVSFKEPENIVRAKANVDRYLANLRKQLSEG